MSELIQLGAHSYYIPGKPNVGVYVRDTRAYLIDSGLNETQAAAHLALIEAQGWTLTAVLNTHFHADHAGGNHYLQQKTSCPCYCPLSKFVTDPILNPSLLFGAQPAEAFLSEVFLAPASNAEELRTDVLPEGLRVIPLPGHCLEQVGFFTEDGVFYCADAVIGDEELERYKFSYLFNLNDYFASMECLEHTAATWYVPSHETAQREIHPLCAHNRQSCQEMIARILTLCAGEGLNQDALLKAIFDQTGRRLHLQQYVLSSCTLRAYLSFLLDEGQLTTQVNENDLRFRAVQA